MTEKKEKADQGGEGQRKERRMTNLDVKKDTEKLTEISSKHPQGCTSYKTSYWECIKPIHQISIITSSDMISWSHDVSYMIYESVHPSEL